MSSNCNRSIGLNCPIPSSFEQTKDWSQLPDSYSQTPGGTLFSTTPGAMIWGYVCEEDKSVSSLSERTEGINCMTTADDAQFVIDI